MIAIRYHYVVLVSVLPQISGVTIMVACRIFIIYGRNLLMSVQVVG